MKNKVLIKLALLSLICITQTFRLYSQKTGNFITSFIYGGVKHPVAYCVPETYNPSNKYPMIIGIHGCPQAASQLRDALKDFSAKHGVIVMCPDNFGNEITDGGLILRSIDSARSLYNVDTAMVFLTGFSCGGTETLIHGLSGIYKFRGVFPWDAGSPGVVTKYDIKTTIVIAAGSADESLKSDIKLYDSLKVHGSEAYLIIVPGIGHVMPVNFSEIIFKCYQFVMDSNKISISTVPTIEVISNSSERNVTIKNIKHKDNAELELSAYSLSSIVKSPTIKYSSGSDSAILTFQPNAKSSSSTRVIVEAKEKNGTEIGQIVITVNIKIFGKFPAYASSQYEFGTGPENTTDGKIGTYWQSTVDYNQWLCIDLCKVLTIKGVFLRWSKYYAKEYDIKVSSDSIIWEDVYSTTSGTGGKESITFDSIKARYVFLNTKLGKAKFYTLDEMEVDTGQILTGIQNLSIDKNNAQFTLSPSIFNFGNRNIALLYALSNASLVNIAVFNVQGQQIKTIVNKYQQAGNYSINWDALNEQGLPLSNGMYFCKFSTPDFQDQKKLLILK